MDGRIAGSPRVDNSARRVTQNITDYTRRCAPPLRWSRPRCARSESCVRVQSGAHNQGRCRARAARGSPDNSARRTLTSRRRCRSPGGPPCCLLIGDTPFVVGHSSVRWSSCKPHHRSRHPVQSLGDDLTMRAIATRCKCDKRLVLSTRRST